MTMYATLEEAIDAAREEFLADNPVSKPKKRMCNSSMRKSMFYRMATSCGRLSFLPTKGKKANVCLC